MDLDSFLLYIGTFFVFALPVIGLLVMVLLVLRPLLAAIQGATEKRLDRAAGRRQFNRRVFPAELRYIRKRRAVVDSVEPSEVRGRAPSTRRNLVGLAISGGGIRSATVGLGVLQALHAHGIFRHLDYLSTVSGGGFIGGCLTSFLSGKARRRSRLPVDFPFAHEQKEGERPAVEYLRNHANYLAPSGGVDWLRMAWAWGRGVFLNALAVLPWMAFVAAAVGTLTYKDLTHPEVHVPHRAIAIERLEAQLGQARWAISEQRLGRTRWSKTVPAPAGSASGGPDAGPGHATEYALFYSHEVDTADTWQPAEAAWEERRNEIQERILPPDPDRLCRLHAKIFDGLEEQAEDLPDTDELDDYMAALVRLAESRIDPEELTLFYRAAADMEDRCEITLDDPESYFEALEPDNRANLAERRTREGALFDALLPPALGEVPSADSLREILGVDVEELRSFVDAISPPEESPQCKDGVIQGDRTVALRESLLGALPESSRLQALALASRMEAQRLDRLATSVRRQAVAIQKVQRQQAQRHGDLKKEELIDMADRLSPYREELLAQLAADRRRPTRIRWLVDEHPRPFRWSLLGAVEGPEAVDDPAELALEVQPEGEAGGRPEETQSEDGALDEPAGSQDDDGEAELSGDEPAVEAPCPPAPAPEASIAPSTQAEASRQATSITRTILPFAASLLLLFALIYLRHSGAGEPPGWKASFKVLVGLSVLALIATAAIPKFWGKTTIGLAVALAAAPLALPLLERILTISRLRSRHGRRSTLAQRLRRDLRRPDAALLRRRVEGLSTLALLAVAAAFFIDLQRPILDWYHHHALPRPSTAGIAIVVGGLMAVLAFLGGLPAGHRLAQVAKKVALAVVAVFGLGSMFLLYLWMADILVYGSWKMPLHEFIGNDAHILSYGILAVAMFFAARELAHLINANDSSMNGFYRDRLGSAYLAGEDTDGILGPERDLELQKICPDRSGAPYHLINTALNLQASTDESLRGRKSGFFLFSRNFIGSSRTGYCSTREMTETYGPVHLGTAMAISAAAASPNMGTLTVPGLTPLLTLLNARLGYWVPHPGRVAGYRRRTAAARKRRWFSPLRWLATGGNLVRRTRLRPGGNLLWNEIFGRLTERGDAVNVSDGGHLENLGAYELLRRRCKFIFVSDAEADPGLHCGSLAALLRYARNDLGINIDIFLDDLTPDEHGRTRQHAALGQILYPPTKANQEPETGFLLYIKSTVTGDEDLVVREYRDKNPSFPHESTADQFFTEDQFEAYRSLGFHSVQSVLGDREPLQDFDALEKWFEELEVKLAPASGAPALPAEVDEQLQRIDEWLERPEMATYFHEMHPELPAPAAAADKTGDSQRAEAERLLVLLVTQQLQVMAKVVSALRLTQHRSQIHPAHRGWMNLFRRWASTPKFKHGYRLLITGFPRRLQMFCELVLGLELRLVWKADRDHPRSFALHVEVEGAAGEPPIIGWARRDSDTGEPHWKIDLQPGFDGEETRRRATLELERLPAADA